MTPGLQGEFLLLDRRGRELLWNAQKADRAASRMIGVRRRKAGLQPR